MKKRVALLVETSSIYGRDLLSGIVRFMRIHDDWSVFLEQRDLPKKPPAWLAKWNGDGIISRATTPQLLAAVASTGVPLVELTDRQVGSTLPCVRSNDSSIGRMAAEHLLERGFQRFVFCGFQGEAWSKRREEAFVDVVAIDAPEIAAVIRFIRENACRGISVDDVTANVEVSRSTLERQLRKHLGRSPQEEIRFVQVKRAKELLLTTDLSVENLAERCGFEHSEYLHVVFKRITGMTPGQFRNQTKP